MNLKRFVAFVFVLFGLSTVAGCKHPLAIEGRGDIFDTGNSGRGCTFEEYQSGDAKCTENEVTGAYSVNYKAEPRAGWRFVRWDGPCSPQSRHQHCSFELDDGIVDWWEENYPGEEIPASTAVFARISGNRGYLLGPGAPVAGIEYKTPTQEGMTGLDGSFQYGEGERVRFAIGSLVLGEVAGKEQVTPFDLAESAVLEGLPITWALQDEQDSFQKVVNISVLLQSLDQDGDPANGLEVTPGIASLIPDEQIELQQSWKTFRADPVVHHVIGRANERNRFSTSHGIARPETVMEDLYAALERDPQLVGVSVLENEGNQNSPGNTERWQYGLKGHLIRHENSSYGDDAFETWQYDGRGNATRHEQYAPEFNGHQLITDWIYDERDHLVHYQQNAGGETGGSTETGDYEYDADGNLVRTVVIHQDNNGSSTHDTRFGYAYYAKGAIARFEKAEYSEESGLPEVMEKWRYDENRRPIRHELVLSEGYREVEAWQYDEKGEVIRYVSQGDSWRYEYEYDDSDRLIQKLRLVGTSTIVDTRETWEYNAEGRAVKYDCEGSCDGEQSLPFAEQRTDTWQYHANGTVSLHEIVMSLEFEDLGEPHTIMDKSRYYYDQQGLLKRREAYGGEDTVEHIHRWKYDANGKLIRFQSIENTDGRLEQAEYWFYDEKQNLTSYEVDDNGNGVIDERTTYEYVSTGWGYLFSGVNSFGRDDPPPQEPKPGI